MYDSAHRKFPKEIETFRKAPLVRNQINIYCDFNFSTDSLNAQVIKDVFRLRGAGQFTCLAWHPGFTEQRQLETT